MARSNDNKMAGFFGAAVSIVVGLEGALNRLEHTLGADVTLTLHELGRNLWQRSEVTHELLQGTDESPTFDNRISVRLPCEVLKDARQVLASLKGIPSTTRAPSSAPRRS